MFRAVWWRSGWRVKPHEHKPAAKSRTYRDRWRNDADRGSVDRAGVAVFRNLGIVPGGAQRGGSAWRDPLGSAFRSLLRVIPFRRPDRFRSAKRLSAAGQACVGMRRVTGGCTAGAGGGRSRVMARFTAKSVTAVSSVTAETGRITQA